VKPPPFTAVFQAQFPGWGGDDKPVTHPVSRWDDASREFIPTGDQKVCDMPFHTPHGTCMSIRYSHCGPVGIDRKGGVWLLVHDYAIDERNTQWVKYPAKVRR